MWASLEIFRSGCLEDRVSIQRTTRGALLKEPSVYAVGCQRPDSLQGIYRRADA
jgi:hypothetical protein